jgi:cell filamentation protein
MYAAADDPYCYPGTDVLRNIPGIRDGAELNRFETAATHQ